jgi:membrane associated rhomboid family serine protease
VVPQRIPGGPITRNFGPVTDLVDHPDIDVLHGGWMHHQQYLYLWIFGDNIEDNWARQVSDLLLLCGVVHRSLIYWLIESVVPSLGASGAIAECSELI